MTQAHKLQAQIQVLPQLPPSCMKTHGSVTPAKLAVWGLDGASSKLVAVSEALDQKQSMICQIVAN